MAEFNYEKIRYKCANCNYVFDVTHPIEYKSYDIGCPQCNSNACDRQEKEGDK